MEGKYPKGKTPPMYEAKRLFGLRRWDKALLEFLSVDAANFTPAEDAELAYFIGLCYAKLGRYDDGLPYLERVISAGNDPLRVCQCRMTLAYIYVITGRAKMAEIELGQLLKSGFESAQIYTTLAYAAWTQKQYEKSVDFYEKALDLDKNNATAMNGLGYVLSDANIDLKRGLRFCRQAVEKNPQNPAYLDSLGWAYFQSGDLAEARNWLRRALGLAPQNEEIRVHMKIATGDSL